MELDKDRRYYFARYCWVHQYKLAPSGLTWAEVFERNEGVKLHAYARERMKAKEVITQPLSV